MMMIPCKKCGKVGLKCECKPEWDFKNKREELIKMVRNALEKKVSPNMAMDLVDACIVAVWEHYDLKKTLRKLEFMGVISEGERSRILQDYQNMDKALKPSKEA